MRVREKMKKALSILLCLCMLTQNCPVMAFAAADDNLCEHHPSHTAECGYAEGREGSDCAHVCGEECGEVCIHSAHDEVCGYIEAVEAHPCHFLCDQCGAEETTEPSSEATEPSTEATEPSAEAAPVEPVPVEKSLDTVTANYVPETDLPGSDELFAYYADGKLYGYEMTTFGTRAGSRLSGVNQAIYNYLKGKIESVALSGGSTVFDLSGTSGLKTQWTNTELGVTSIEDDSLVEAAFEEQYDHNTIVDALLADCPFDLYWFDKAVKGATRISYQFGYSGQTVGGVTTWTTATLQSFTITFTVASGYQGGNANTVTGDVSRVNTARAKAAAIVEKYKDKTDLEKLTAYKDEICALTAYNDEAAKKDYTGGYGDPWQLINVFDGDDSTTVVCEGYSKAFQYLCDLSGLDCISVSGHMTGGTGEGGHMWNVITLDGANYLVDVTNCDEGTVGAPDELFMVGGAYANGGYSYTIGSQTVTYTCDNLNLSETDYSAAPETSGIPAGYYLVGSLGGEDKWSVDHDASSRLLQADPDTEGQYFLDYTFVGGDELKIAYFDGTIITRLFQEESQDSYTIGAGSDKVGHARVLFMPAGNPEWSYNYFTVMRLYDVVVSAAENGTVEASPEAALAGEDVTLTITPAEGYELRKLEVLTAANTPVTVRDNVFTMPGEPVTVEAVFGTTEKRTVYFDNRKAQWESVNVFFWSEDTLDMTTWPGEAMTAVEGNIYSYEIPADAETVIFNNGTAQTSDQPLTEKNCCLGTVESSAWYTYPCSHTFADGECTLCGAVCDHNFDSTGKCICGIQAVAKIGETYYLTLAQTAAEVTEGDTIHVLTDVTVGADETLTFAAFAKLNVAEGKNVTVSGAVKIGEAEGIIFENTLYYYGGTADTNWEIDNIDVPTYWTAGEGYAIFQPAVGEETAVLTLHNATLNLFCASFEKGSVVFDESLTIRFSGSNHLTTTNDTVEASVFHIMGDTIMEGIGQDAELNLQGGNHEDYSTIYGSIFDRDLTVRSGTVNIRSGNDGNSCCGVSVAGTLTVASGAVLNAAGGESLYDFSCGLIATDIVTEGTLNALWLLVDESENYSYQVYGNTVLEHDLSAVLEIDGEHSYKIPFSVPVGTSLTVNSGVTLDLSKLELADIDFTGTVINNGTILLPADFALDNAPKSGHIRIGEKSYTWDSANNKWICGEGSHTGGTATCVSGPVCDICGNTYGEVDKTNHDTENAEYDNGFCVNCDAYEPAELVDGVYQIGNAGNLYWFADKVTNENATYGSANAILTDNIVVNEGTMTASSTDARVWTPIGKFGFGVNYRYTGTFDGIGKTVSGLYFNDTSAMFSVGLFSVVGEGGTVQNVGIADSYLCGYQNIGGVVGSNFGTVTGCHNSSTVSGRISGGVVGSNDGTVTDCHNTGTVSGTTTVGGVVGSNDGTVTDCYNTGTVSGTSDVGGVAGYNAGTATNCYNTGTVSGTDYVGGVASENLGTATNCYNTGAVSGESKVGGVVGDNWTTVTNCYNTGTVSGTTNVGGVVGNNIPLGIGTATVTGCYFDSTVYTGDAIGTNSGTAADVEGKSTEQFKRGEVAYLLSQGENGDLWGQDLDNGKPAQTAPTFTGAKVYYGYPSCGDAEKIYTNDSSVSAEKPAHSGSLTCKDNADGTHTATWSCCGTAVTESHDFANEAHKCLCGLIETFTVTVDDGNENIVVSLSNTIATFGQDFTAELRSDVEKQPHYEIFWYTVNGENYGDAAYENGMLTIPAANITGDIEIRVKPYVTVTFHGNGGVFMDPPTGDTKNPIVRERDYGKEAYIRLAWDGTREGYTYTSYNTKQDGTGTEYHEQTRYAHTEDLVLYAQWEINQYTITFDPANGQEKIDITQDYGTAITAPEFTYDGYHFVKWDTEVPATMPAIWDEEIIITAQWAPHTGGQATCQKQAECETCGESYGALADHSVSYSADGMTITRKCATCDTQTAAFALVIPTDAVWGDLSLPYYTPTDGGENKPVITYTRNGAPVAEPTDAGTYDVTMTWGDQTVTEAFTIAKAKNHITLDTTPITVTYGETVTLPTATATFGTVSRDKTAADLVNAGTYTVTYFVEEAANYESASKTLTVTVEKLAVAEPAVSGSYVYTGTEQTVTLAGLEDCMTVASGNQATDAGTHEITITLDSNHKWAEGSDGKISWTVEKAKTEISLDTAPITVTYGETVTLPTSTATFGTVSCDKTAADLVNVGTYTVTYTVESTANFEGDTETLTVTVEKLAVAEPAVTGTYTYDGKEQTVTLTGQESFMTVASGNKGTNAATYEVTVTLDGNHKWADGSDGKLEWSIAPRTVTITGATIADVLYREDGLYGLTVTGVTMDGVAEGDELVLGVDFTATASWFGENQLGQQTADVTISMHNNSNYENTAIPFAATFNIVTHVHEWKFTAEGDIITAACEGRIGQCDVTTATVALKGPENLAYDGKTKTVTVSQSPAGIFADVPAVEYTGDCKSTGDHTAKLTYGGVTAQITFTITCEHTYQAGEYLWNENGTACTVTGTCSQGCGAAVTARATVTAQQTREPTCTDKGETTYTATFAEAWAARQTRTLADIPAKDHAWTVSYQWSEDGKSCTATRTCGNDTAHNLTEKATVTSAVKTAATCETKGWTTFTANFEADWAVSQTKDVEDIPALGHAWTVSYRWSEDGKSCTASRICGNDAAHNVTAEAVVTAERTKEPTLTAMGETTYTASFDADWAEKQTKTLADIPVLNKVEISESEGGDVTVDKETPETGESVTITVDPEPGQEAADVIVRDENGNRIPVTENEDGSYTYQQPEGDVTIEVIFRDFVSEKVENIVDRVEDRDPETVTSADKADLEQIIDDIEELLKEESLTEEEKTSLEDAKADAEDLLAKIEAAKNAIDTENTEKVEDVTAGNVQPEDQQTLEDAREDLEKALEDYSGNYTEAEKQAIEKDIQRMEEALKALEHVRDVAEQIRELPKTVEPDDEETAEEILAAKQAYDRLTDHEKSLLEKALEEKLSDLIEALTDYVIVKGNRSKWSKGSDHGLTFKANGPFSKFVGIEVDGRDVHERYYAAKEGSTIITLKQSFLKRLSTGTHTITVLYTDGEASGTFRILPASSNPQTSDNFDMTMWSSIAIINLLCMAALVLNKKKFYS